MEATFEMLNSLPGMAYQCQNPADYIFTFISEGSKGLTGYSPEELKHKKILDIVHPGDAKELLELWEVTLKMGVPLENTFRIITKDGREKLILAYCQVAETNDEWMPHLFTGYWADVSRLLRIENSRKDNRAAFNFLDKISHNMRTLLNAVIGMAELGLRENMPYKVRDYTVSVKKSGEGLMSVFNNVLDYTSLQGSNLEINSKKYSLSSLISEVKLTAKGWLADAPLKFDVNVGAGIPDSLLGDGERLRQIILHLLSNSIKFTDSGAIHLLVSGKVVENTVALTITVEDTGRGIKEEDFENVFAEFVQLDTKNIEGTGLGLTITRGLLKLMGGDIHVSSMHGLGSVFTVTVSQEVCSHDKYANDEENFDAYIRFTAPGARALIVDDIDLNLMISSGLLRPYKMQLDLCTNGADAIAAVKSNKYDLIFMDHIMPVMDGLETVSRIRKLDDCKTHCKEVPIIALTANADTASKEMFLSSGFDDFLPKPVDVSQLHVVVEKWVPEEKRQANETAPQNTIDESSLKIVGVNTSKGIAMAGGNLEKYLPVLNDFYVYASDMESRFKSSLAKGDLEAYRIQANSLKSASGNIGAERLHFAAEAFELAATESDTAFIQSNCSKLYKELGAVLQNIYPHVKGMPKTSVKPVITSAKKPKVLVIDDSPTVLYMLCDILKDDYVSVVVQDGRIGLYIAQKSLPDLILLDLTMAGISGYDVLKRLKTNKATKAIPVILISGSASYEDQIEGYSLGAVEYITKPFVRDIVKHKIDFNMRYILMEQELEPKE